MTIYTQFAEHIGAILDRLAEAGDIPADLDRGNVAVEPPRDPGHGDLATNVAMVLAKPAGKNPRELAALIAQKIARLEMVSEAEIAGPGFINIRLDDDAWRDELQTIFSAGDDYGKSAMGEGKTVNVEYVSANPTGPLHMGHCRGAVVGDALANLLEFSGYRVIREYYVNDAGGQVDVLAKSTYLRYIQALGHTGNFTTEQFPWLETQFEDFGDPNIELYPGEYLVPIAEGLAHKFGKKFVNQSIDEWLALFRERSVAAMLDLIRADLARLGIRHDLFASEADIQAAGKPKAAEAELRERGLIYDGALEMPKGKTPDDWEPVELPLFKSTEFGDDQDRPIRKSDGSWTYFGSDLAYHFHKSQSADILIDIWGADHVGTVKRIKAAVSALTQGEAEFDIKIVQMVRLLRDGEPAKMSKRSGSFITLADVIEEVGKDVVRFAMLTHKADTPMDFDFAKVVEASKHNPVFYVQYAHARIRSVYRKAEAEGVDLSVDADLNLLDGDELALVKLGAKFSRIVEAAAATYEPHRIAYYLFELAAEFHALWNRGNDYQDKRLLVVNDADLTRARLALAAGIGQIIRNGLAIMGVEAVEEME